MQTIGDTLKAIAARERAGMPAAVSFVQSAGPVPAGAVADLLGGLVPAYEVRGLDVVVLPSRVLALLFAGAVRPGPVEVSA